MNNVSFKEGLVSIIIPVYNASPYIGRCIRSIQRQTYKKLEIIVIDDGSDDGTSEILNREAQTDPRVQVVHQENRGTGSARNLGIDMARGEFLTFVDGDDYLRKGYVEALLHRIEETSADMVLCGICFVDENGKVLRRLVPEEYSRFSNEIWPMRISTVCSHFYRRSFWEDTGIRFASGVRGEDLPVSLYFAAQCTRIAVSLESGYAYLQHNSSAMHHFRGLKTMDLPLRALEDIICRISSEGVKNSSEFHELFVLRILATFLFDLSRGASAEKQREVREYAAKIVREYYPDYRNNPLTRLNAHVDVPFSQKAAVWLLTKLLHLGVVH